MGGKYAITNETPDEAWEDLDPRCRKCQYITEYASCKLRQQDDTEDECPLNNISCQNCYYCCDIIQKDGEKVENIFYCYLNDELLDGDASACREYIKENE